MARGPHDYIDPNKLYPNSLHFMENSFLSFLQAVFSLFPPDQNRYHYDSVDSISEIYIEGQNTDNLEIVDARPKIVVARGPVSLQKSGINNFVGAKNLSAEHRQFAGIRSGSVGISCYSRTDLEADRLAEICADSIESLVPQIRGLGFLEVRTTDIGQRAMIKADSRPELFVTPVLVRASLTKNYRSVVMDPVKLREIIYQFVVQPIGLRIPPTT